MKRCLILTLIVAVVFSGLFSGLSSIPSYAAEVVSELDLGKEAGKETGNIDGEVAGTLDATAKKSVNPSAAMPKDQEIIEKYNLINDTPTYRSAFLAAYKEGFRTGYLNAYRKTSLEMAQLDPGKLGGETLGTAYGARDAMIDFQRARNNDPDAAYKRFLAQGSLASRFHLGKESKEFAKTFSDAFAASYRKSYVEAYSTRNIEHEARNAATYEVAYFPKDLEYTWGLYDTSTGGVSGDLQYVLRMNFPEGSIVEPTRVSIAALQHSFGWRNYRYTPATPVVRISLENVSGRFDFQQPVTMSFAYYGSEKVGIYRWQNGRWEYMTSVLSDEGTVSTVFEPGKPIAGDYALFIDEKAATVRDSVQHWARKEINLFARRHFIDGNALFRPDAEMTRAELAQLLYAVLGHVYPTGYAPYISDVGQNNPAADAIRFVTSLKFMSPDATGKFYPNMKVTYQHLEYIYRNILGKSFNWVTFGNKMMREKYYRSPGLVDKKLAVRRAEVLYFLYENFLDQ